MFTIIIIMLITIILIQNLWFCQLLVIHTVLNTKLKGAYIGFGPTESNTILGIKTGFYIMLILVQLIWF